MFEKLFKALLNKIHIYKNNNNNGLVSQLIKLVIKIKKN